MGSSCGCWSECTRYQAARKDVVSRYRRASKAKGTGTTSVLDKGYDNPTGREAVEEYTPHVRRIGEEKWMRIDIKLILQALVVEHSAGYPNVERF